MCSLLFSTMRPLAAKGPFSGIGNLLGPLNRTLAGVVSAEAGVPARHPFSYLGSPVFASSSSWVKLKF